MGKKKKSKRNAKPWCYYCDRSFNDEKVLIDHQKARHFKCPECFKRLLTAGGLQVHMNQVHKTSLDKVPNAIEGRDSMKADVYGMSGIPEDMIIQRRMAESKPPPKKRQRRQEKVQARKEAAAAAAAAAAPAAPVPAPAMPPPMMAPTMMQHMGPVSFSFRARPMGMPAIPMTGMPPAIPASGLPPGWPPGMAAPADAGAAPGAVAAAGSGAGAGGAGAGSGAGAGTGSGAGSIDPAAAALASGKLFSGEPLNVGKDTILIHPHTQAWSMEEIRAALPKYKFDEKAEAAEAAAMQKRIASALS